MRYAANIECKKEMYMRWCLLVRCSFPSVQILVGHRDGAARRAELAHELVVAGDATGPGCAPLFGPLQPEMTGHEHAKGAYGFIDLRIYIPWSSKLTFNIAFITTMFERSKHFF